MLFTTVPNRKQNALFPIETIGNHVGALAKLDHPFTELRRQIVDGTANLGMGGENPDTWGSPCCSGTAVTIVSLV